MRRGVCKHCPAFCIVLAPGRLGAGTSRAVAGGAGNLSRNRVQGQGDMQSSSLGAGARHSVDDACRLVLREGRRARRVKLFHALRAVRTHAGQQPDHGMAPDAGRRRVELEFTIEKISAQIQAIYQQIMVK